FNFDNKRIIKFLVLLDESPTQNICKIKEQLKKLSKYIYFLNSQSNALDIMPNNISKGYGLKILANNKIINLDKTICFGDADNDISMFKVCRYKVAMANANQEVKEKANFVTDSTKEDGIYNFFKKYIKW
ncbi:MAG: HAD-IIB family hydrolase, partial [Mycoplasma sp.]|nr:HAD-IIB family hydrolase [Mycoplasma sp.]